MEERYWLRHPSFRGHQGPLTRQEIKQALASQSFPRDCYALRDEGQTEDARLASVNWIPVWELLGIAPPEGQRTPLAVGTATDGGYGTTKASGGPSTDADTRERLRQLRRRTAYSALRSFASVLCWITVILLLLTTLMMLIAARAEHTPVTVMLTLLIATVEAMGVILAYGLVQALLDIADNSIHQHYKETS